LTRFDSGVKSHTTGDRPREQQVGYEESRRRPDSLLPPVITVNAAGGSPMVLACDHASNRLPPGYGDLGLKPHQRLMHIAWDPGALAVALQMSDLLDAPLVQSTVSRLVIDCNRAPDAVDLIPVVSERTDIIANIGLPESERLARLAAFHAPFHSAIDAVLAPRQTAPEDALLVTIHSFTPTYKGIMRPWPIGLIPGTDERLTRALYNALQAEDPELNIGWNEPYSARNGVTYTLDCHGARQDLHVTMIEIRHDLILEPEGVSFWATRLARTLERARLALGGAPDARAGAQVARERAGGPR
jgi:predicted N-formylglutamate amidohydrolase